MADAYEDVIRAKLNHTAISNIRTNQPAPGSWQATIDYNGTERNLQRLLNSEFDVITTQREEEGVITAQLTVNNETM